MSGVIYFIIALVVLLIIYFGIMYLNLKKQQKQIIKFQEELQVNKNVILSSGIYGKITYISQDYINVEIAPHTTIKVARYGIMKVVD